MVLNKHEDGDIIEASETNQDNAEAYTISGLNLVRMLQDREIDFSSGGFDWWGDAYVDSNGRMNSVDTGNTDATFDTDKYETTGNAISYIVQNITVGIFSSTASSAIGVPFIGDWETGADIQFRLGKGVSYDNVYIDTKDIYPKGLFFKPDGTKMYEIGTNSGKVYQWSLSSAWDLSSATYDSVYIDAEDFYPTGLFFKPDGTKMYEIGSVSDKVYQYSLSSAWDLSTASYDNVSIGTEDNAPKGLFFKSDGTKMYEIGSNKVYQWSLSSAWDLSSATYDSVSIGTDNVPHGLFFKPDGTKMYEMGFDGGKVYQYSLSSAWDLSSSFTMDYKNVNEIVNIPEDEYTKLEIKLIPKDTNPQAGYPSLRGFSIRCS